jgi:DNA-binding CsgD family transcriptional regulator/tetratricopeptide (TPR) repeat protein
LSAWSKPYRSRWEPGKTAGEPSRKRELAGGVSGRDRTQHGMPGGVNAGGMVSQSVLLERERELQVLTGAVQGITDSASVVVVTGGAGAGKTRLLREADALAETAGVRVVSARGAELEREFGFGVMRQLFEPVLAGAGAGLRERLLSGPAAMISEMLGWQSAPVDGAEDFARLNGWFWLLANMCREGPLVVLVDDAQWADAASLRALAFVLPRMQDLGLLLVVAVRPEEPGGGQRMLDLIFTDPAAQVLRLRPLSRRGAAALVERLMGVTDTAFVEACWAATAGNPLLLRELAETLAADGITASRQNIRWIEQIGPGAASHWVARWLESLPGDYCAFAGAAAVLGEAATVSEATELAGLSEVTGAKAAAGLEHIEMLQLLTGEPGEETEVRFVHPLVRTAMYQRLDPADRASGHAAAARMLAGAGAAPERVAGQMLSAPPSGDAQTVAWLRQAAASAADRGSPETALTYLQRCLAEPPADDHLTLDILLQAGLHARSLDMRLCCELLGRADRLAAGLAVDAAQRADIGLPLGSALLMSGQLETAERAFRESLDALPGNRAELRSQALAWVTMLHTWASMTPAGGRSAGESAAAGLPAGLRTKPGCGPAGQLLDCALSAAGFLRGDPDAVMRARRALTPDLLTGEAWLTSAVACFPLISAGADEVHGLLEDALKLADHGGELVGLGLARSFQGLNWLHRGQLAEAEPAAAEGARLLETAASNLLSPMSFSWLAAVLVEQGRYEEASLALQRPGLPSRAPLNRITCFYAEVQSRLSRLTGHHEQALRTALTYGSHLREMGFDSPAAFTWRTEAALALRELGRHEEARHYAMEQLPLARHCGVARVIGHALRIAALTAGGRDGVEMLREAAAVLEESPAQLEYAKTLAHFGAALRECGQSAEARAALRQALDLATGCGAAPLAEYARTELVVAGGRPRRTATTGVGSLTPSELRVARLAAEGATNRGIAQQLFVTPKTVEVHLGNVYRKLTITSRDHLPEALRA